MLTRPSSWLFALFLTQLSTAGLAATVIVTPNHQSHTVAPAQSEARLLSTVATQPLSLIGLPGSLPRGFTTSPLALLGLPEPLPRAFSTHAMSLTGLPYVLPANTHTAKMTLTGLLPALPPAFTTPPLSLVGNTHR